MLDRLKRAASKIWGNFESVAEVRKFGLLAVIFGLIIGTYWTLRPIKDGIFGSVVGGDYLNWAKILSVIVIFPIVIIYSKLIDKYPRTKVFYGLVTFYGILALVFAWFFMDPQIGLPNTVAHPLRIIGWLWYVWVESFGSLIPALFWAITTDSTMPESAKRGFPIIALFAQVGNFVGPYFLTAQRWEFAHSGPIIAICAGLLFMVVAIFWLLIKTTPEELMRGYHGDASHQETESEPGFFEGLKLLCTEKYLLGLFLIIFIFEAIVTVLDNHFKVAVIDTFGSEVLRTAYLSQYAYWTGIVSGLCVFLGINNIQKWFGMKISLILTPVAVGAAVLLIKFNPQTLVIAFWIMVLSKAINYALNQPSMKQLYIPTSKNARYKAQAWIEMFGGRSSKASGAGITLIRKPLKEAYGAVAGVDLFLTISSIISFGLIGFWFIVILYVSKTYTKAIKDNKVVC
jgi:AAA family ATP:ADP antiporter